MRKILYSAFTVTGLLSCCCEGRTSVGRQSHWRPSRRLGTHITSKSLVHQPSRIFVPQHQRDVGQTLSLAVLLRGGDTFSGRVAPQTMPRPGSSQQQQQSEEGYKTDSLSETKEVVDAFLTRDSRNTFISRVYAILGGQLLVTALSIFLFGRFHWAQQWMYRPGFGAAVPGISLLLSTIAWFAMCVSATARRASPLKWQLLSIFTLGEAISLGFVTSFFQFETVLTAMLATAVATASISIYTIANRNSKYDLSQWGAGLTSAGLIFLCLSLVQLPQVTGVLPKGFMPLNNALLSFAGATLFSFYLAYHTRMLVGGKHTKYQMAESDYVFGAMMLYNDIINIFIYILRILGDDRE